jgi:glyoxylase-like metal-dependent hydrolase (beta-lactamase superfamily II)
MAAYIASLEKLMSRDDQVYYPGHGEQIDKPQRWVRGLIGHRKQREGQILRLLGRGVGDLPGMVAQMYVGIDPRLKVAAERSVLAHLIDLERRGRVRQEGGTWNGI